jgi:hypothetical protein
MKWNEMNEWEDIRSFILKWALTTVEGKDERVDYLLRRELR